MLAATPPLRAFRLLHELELLFHLSLIDDVFGVDLRQIRSDKRDHASVEQYLNEFPRVDDAIAVDMR